MSNNIYVFRFLGFLDLTKQHLPYLIVITLLGASIGYFQALYKADYHRAQSIFYFQLPKYLDIERSHHSYNSHIEDYVQSSIETMFTHSFLMKVSHKINKAISKPTSISENEFIILEPGQIPDFVRVKRTRDVRVVIITTTHQNENIARLLNTVIVEELNSFLRQTELGSAITKTELLSKLFTNNEPYFRRSKAVVELEQQLKYLIKVQASMDAGIRILDHAALLPSTNNSKTLVSAISAGIGSFWISILLLVAFKYKLVFRQSVAV